MFFGLLFCAQLCSQSCSNNSVKQTYFIPFDENDSKDFFLSVYPSVSDCWVSTCNVNTSVVQDPINKYVSINVIGTGTIIYYDHWEDGYEFDAQLGITQSTTEVWGDGDLTNGIAPGYPSDSFVPGDVLILSMAVNTPNTNATVERDAMDKVLATKNILMSAATWATGTNTLLAGGAPIISLDEYSTDFTFPVGENANVDNMFRFTGAFIQASKDGTTVSLDLDANGVFESTLTLNEGESHLINGGINLGAKVSSTAPISVVLATADPCDGHESRFFKLNGDDMLSNAYISPVGTPATASTLIHVYNPSSSTITINYEFSSGSPSTINVPANSSQQITVPNMNGARLRSNDNFYALSTIDSSGEITSGCQENGLRGNHTHDWGFALLPESALKGQVLGVAWGEGQDPTYTGTSTENSSPVWVTASYPMGSSSSGAISVCFDFNGDGGTLTDPIGNTYDQLVMLDELESAAIYDPDGDQTAISFWVCDGSDALLAGAWGQDPNTASTGSPAIDVGTALLAGVSFEVGKVSEITTDVNADGLLNITDTIEYCLCVNNIGKLNYVEDVLLLKDEISSYYDYIPGSSYFTYDGVTTPVADDASPNSLYPLDEAGWLFSEVLEIGENFTFCYKTKLNSLVPEDLDFINNVACVSDEVNTQCAENNVELGCEINLSGVSVSECSDGVYTVSGSVSWINAPSDKNITVALNGVSTEINVTAGLSPPQTFSLQILADGNEHSLTAGFDDTCEVSMSISSPAACFPELTFEKSFVSAVQTSTANQYTLTYEIQVQNIGTEGTNYDLYEFPSFDDDVVIQSASFTSDVGLANTLSLPVPSNPGWLLANDVVIAADESQKFTVQFLVLLNLADGSIGDDIYSTCSSNGSGLFNLTQLDLDENTSNFEYSDSACGELPYLKIEKRQIDAVRQLNDSWVITYLVGVSNCGGANGIYDLVEFPQFDNDIVILEAEFESSNGLSDSNLGLPMPTGGWKIGDDVFIGSGQTHNYTLELTIGYDFFDNLVGDDSYSSCTGNGSAGEGLFNEAQLDVNNDGTPDATDTTCEDLEEFDLALRKVIKSVDSYEWGASVVFEIEVVNQGISEVSEVEIIEYIPCGFEYLTINDGVWTYDSATHTAKTTVSVMLEMGENVKRDISLQLKPCYEGANQWLNFAEICSFKDKDGNTAEDIDSTPDCENDNDAGGRADSPNDNYLFGNAQGVVGDDVAETDEDDHDPARLALFDLALAKRIVTARPYTYGQDITFEIEICNQGNLTASQIEITDYIPVGFSFDVNKNNPNASGTTWSGADPKVETTLSANLTPGDCQKLEIVLEFNASTSMSAWDNYAEISNFKDEDGNAIIDIDSRPDDIKNNDAGGMPSSDADNFMFGNGLGVAGDGIALTDEDDHDPAFPEIIDIALRKTVTTPSPYIYGQSIEFKIEVINQGSSDLKNIEITDFIPCGLTFDLNNFTKIPAWSLDDAKATTSIDLLKRGESKEVYIDLLLTPRDEDCNWETAYINIAEVSEMFSMDDEDVSSLDIDSKADDDKENDVGGTPDSNEDNHVDDDGQDSDGDGILDEDDHDPVRLEVFDLALQKRANPIGPYNIGDTCRFDIDVCNQGNVAAKNIELSDYLPIGLAFDSSNPLNNKWSVASGSTLRYKNIEDVIHPDECATISIYLEVLSDEMIELLNMAEISYSEYEDGAENSKDDADSEADDNNFNDNGNEPFSPLDDEMFQNGFLGGDEDDHDQAFVIACGDIACHGDINLSLDEMCVGNITAGMLLSPVLFPEDMYEITLTDEFGNVITDPQNHIFTAADIGNCYSYSVVIPMCSNQNCWGTVCIEDKFPPAIDCGGIQEVFACSFTEADFGSITPPTISDDNCGSASLVLLSQTITPNDDCDPSDLLGTVVRCYKAVDDQGNERAECCQTIEVKRLTISNITIPSAFSSTDCTVNTDIASLGVPFIDNDMNGVLSAGDVELLPVPTFLCNLMVSYEDVMILEDACHKQFMRMWRFSEWWCGGVTPVVQMPQMIEVWDLTPPSITCPSAMTFSTTGGFGVCQAEVTLPMATVSDDCNSPVEVDILYPGGFIDNSNGGLATLGVGTHTVTYVAYDGCYNSNECTMEVTILDQTQPTVLCEQNTVVSLQEDGFIEVEAWSFDDGSYDDCMMDRFEVRRMSDPCGVSGLSFGETVTFCCSDVGQDVMVVFRVYDSSGNYNECMVNVEVQDKNAAILSCPSNISLDCGDPYDLNNLSGQFGEAVVIGSCGANITITETMTNAINNCGLGSITRNFSAPDGLGGTLSCTQIITITDSTPFDGDDPSQLLFPLDYSSSSMCDFTDVTPENIELLSPGNGFPIINEDGCDLVAVNYEDQEFSFANDPSACFKVLRTWTVIDWCQRRVDGTFEEWTHVQEIKISNEIAPTIDSGLDFVLVESVDVNCASAQVSLGITASDDCPSNVPLSYSYVIDLDKDGTIDATGTKADASGTYPIGIHSITWQVLDGCGNEVSGSHDFEVRNVKPPVAVCIQGLSVDLTLMDTDGDNVPDTNMAILNASNFDKDSYHPCGYDVSLSFSSNPADNTVTFDCSDVGQQGVQLWVTDENGNQSFCSTFIIVEDNDMDCPMMSTTRVGGRIFTELDESVEDVRVELLGSSEESMSEETGEYAFADMPTGGEYVIDPGKNDDVMNGISTLDLVLIQKHLLQTSPLNSPYKLIAADVNRDDKVSSIDLIELRKLILGIYVEFPDNDSWRFVDAMHSFVDPTDPWLTPIPEEYNIPSLITNMDVDFVGVKIGDVNQSAAANLLDGNIDTRDNSLSLKLMTINDKVRAGETIDVQFSSNNFESIVGFQLTMLHEGLEYIDVKQGALDMRSANIGQFNDRMLTMSWNEADVKGRTESKEVVLFTIGFKATKDLDLSDVLKITDEVTQAEVYVFEETDDAYHTEGIEMKFEKEASSKDFVLMQNEPNPWTDHTSIEVTVEMEEEVILIVQDASGKEVFRGSYKLKAGPNKIVLSKNEVKASGVYNYSVISNERILAKQMIKI